MTIDASRFRFAKSARSQDVLQPFWPLSAPGTSGDDVLTGTSGDDTLSGLEGNDLFLLQQGGNDTVSGDDGNDGFYFGGAFTAADVVDGGNGTLDQVALQGNYAAVLTLSATSLVNVEQVVLLSGADTRFGDTANNIYAYNLVLNDSNVAAGQVLSFSANTLRSSENFTLDASAETDGSIVTYGGAGIDKIIGSQQSDRFFFGNNLWGASDRVDGQAGALDQLIIQGNYFSNKIIFGPNQMVGIEYLTLLHGVPSLGYDITLNDNNVVSGPFTVDASGLTGDNEVLYLRAQAETNVGITVYGGNAADQIIGGQQGDIIYGGGNADILTGGGGNDIFAYRQISDSTRSLSDGINDFASGDRIDLSLVDADSTQPGIQHFTLVNGTTPSLPGQLVLITSGLNQLLGEVDGLPGPDFRIVIANGYVLTINDLIGVQDGRGAALPEGASAAAAPVMPADATVAAEGTATEPAIAALFVNAGHGTLADVGFSALAFDHPASEGQAMGHTEYVQFVMEPPLFAV